MDQFLSWVFEGVPFGCVYALIAVGLVLTYKTTGVFNLAFSAQAFVAGAVYTWIVLGEGQPSWFGFLVAVFIVSPLIGLLFDRALFRYMRTASWEVKLVSVLGLFIAIPEIVKAVYERQPVPVTLDASIANMVGLDPFDGVSVGDAFISNDLLIVVIITVVVVALLGLVFRYTATGLQMRAVVESPRMVELAGVDSERVSAVSWMLSSTLAGLAGVMLAPLVGSLDANIYGTLTIVCVAAAAIGRLESIPLAFAGGIMLGFADRALPNILSDFGVESGDQLSKDLRPTLPFIVLFLVLVFSKSLRRKREAADPLAGVDPPPPAMAHTYKNEELARFSRIMFPIFIVLFLLAMNFLVSDLWVFRITDGFTLAVVFLSITVFTGLGGQISLAQATFAGIGGFAGAGMAADHGIPIVVGILIGALLAAAVGAILSLPVMRLQGIYLTLATLAFALMVEQIAFNRAEVSNSTFGIDVPRPDLFEGDKEFFFFVFLVFGIVAALVVLVRNGTTGRFFAAIRGSETAAASIGINANLKRVTLFALAAAIAGIGGGLIAMLGERVAAGDAPTYPALIGVAWVVIVVTIGSRTVDGAVNAGLSFVIFRWLLEDALQFEPGIFIIFFGLGAITYARHPEGIVEFQTRRSIQGQIRSRALNARAKILKARGQLPNSFTPVAHAVLPAAILPVAYFLYIIVGSLFVDGWLAVHASTLLWFIVPTVLYVLGWMFHSDRVLAREGASKVGAVVMLGAALVGALLGVLLPEIGFALPGSDVDRALVGLAAGAAATMFVWIPVQVERAAAAKGWLEPPITWREGRASALMVLFGVYLFHHRLTVFPYGWPIFFVACAFTIVWLQWIAQVQGALNELAIGEEGAARKMAEGSELDTDPSATLEPVPAGGGE